MCVVDCNTRNLGDHIQSIGAERACRLAFGDLQHIHRIQRCDVSSYRREFGPLLFSGWFAKESPSFIPSVPAVWCGVHLSNYGRSALLGHINEMCLNFVNDVGCRDLSTLEWCKSNGISSYFSRCLSLVIGDCSHSTGSTVFIVNVDEACRKCIPYTGNSVVTIDQRRCGGTIDDAYKLLMRYSSEARLVITSALHCALPCIGLGIPVIVIDPGPEKTDPERFSALSGIVRVYSHDDCLSGRIDFNPEPVDIRQLQKDIIENLRLSVFRHERVRCSDDVLEVRERIASFTAGGIL